MLRDRKCHNLVRLGQMVYYRKISIVNHLSKGDCLMKEGVDQGIFTAILSSRNPFLDQRKRSRDIHVCVLYLHLSSVICINIS